MLDPDTNIAVQLMKAVEHHRRNLPAAERARHDRETLEEMVAQLEELSARDQHTEN